MLHAVPKPERDSRRYDAAKIALLAGEHVEEALGVLVALLKCKRESVRLKAATTLIELAAEQQPGTGTGATKVYVLDSRGPNASAIADELRRRAALPAGG